MTDNRFSFNKNALNKLAPPAAGKRLYVYDSRVPGLGLAVTPKGTKTFLVYRKINGKPERITLGRYPEMDIDNARAQALAINAAIARGENPNDATRQKRDGQTLGELFEDYLELHAKPHKKTWAEDQAQFQRYLSPLASRKAIAIDKEAIQALHLEVGREHGQYAANRMLALLQTVFNKALEWGRVERNPTTPVTPFQEKSRERFLQPEELPRLFQALAEERESTIRDYVLLSLFTGARRSNVLAMRWREIDFRAAHWHIPETKNGSAHLVPLVDPAVEILRRRREAVATSDFVFPANSATGHLMNPQKGWQRVLARAGLENLRLHDLRRSLGSWQASTGANLAVIGKTLNHKDAKSTNIYARLNLDPVRQAMETATQAMLQAAGIAGEKSREEKATDDPKTNLAT